MKRPFLQVMYKQIGTIFGTFFLLDHNVELFSVTFDTSVATLSIRVNTIMHILLVRGTTHLAAQTVDGEAK